jgi:hypothetical protein
VQRAFEGCPIKDVASFSKLVYNPASILDLSIFPVEASPVAWEGMLGLADRLDAQCVLKASCC